MIRLSATSEAAADVLAARCVDVLAYTLRRGPLLGALETAAERGAHVRVRLEGAPFGDTAGALAKYNRRIAGELARCGADVRLARATPASSGDPPVHAKALVADGKLFLDDRNWGEGDFVVADSDGGAVREVVDAIEGRAVHDVPSAPFAFSKNGALQREATLLREARAGDAAVVESESFGYANPVYAALDEFARRGGAPRLLVSSREARNARERAALTRLARDGVDVRLTTSTEKFAVVGAQAWIGSANASPDFQKPEMIDWGLTTTDAATVAAARARVESRWSTAKPFTP